MSDEKTSQETKLEKALSDNIQSIMSDYGKSFTLEQKIQVASMCASQMIPKGDIKIGDSKICGGKGVFATRAIQSGTIVTIYPAHVVGTLQNDGIMSCRGSDEDIKFVQQTPDEKHKNFQDYMADFNGSIRVIGNPDKTSDTRQIGHMINDSAMVDFTDFSSGGIKNTIGKYVVMSKNNCTIKINNDIGLMYILTIRDIAEGEELYCSYDAKYWFDRSVKNHNKDEKTATETFLKTFEDQQLVAFICKYRKTLTG